VNALRVGMVLAAASLLTSAPARAQSLWTGGTANYNDPANWFPPIGAPVAAGQSAVFDASGSTTVNVTSGSIAPNSWTLNSGAQSYTISGGAVNFSLAGPLGGIIDNANAGQTITISNNIGESVAGVQLQLNGSSTLVLLGTNTYTGGTFVNTICGCGTLQLGDPTHMASIVGQVTNQGTVSFINANTSGITSITNNGGETDFFNSTTASSATIKNLSGGTTVFNDFSNAANANITNLASGGSTLFFNDSSAGNAVIINKSGTGSILPVGLGFFDHATAGNATIINDGGFIGFGKPFFIFGPNNDAPTAANATITNTNSGEIDFAAFSTAGNAVITTDKGATVVFVDRSTGGNAQFITNGTGTVDFAGFSRSPGGNAGPNNDGVVTAGSIAGSGTYIIGGITLVVGSNNLSTEVSGVIADTCGCGPGPFGNLTKVGSGTLTLSGNNTYTGVTTVTGGTLLVTGSLDSSTHFSEVMINTGARFGGTGSVPKTFAFDAGAILAPGLPNALGTLTVNDQLGFFNSAALYHVKVTSTGSDLTLVVPNIGIGNAVLAGTVQVTSLNSSYKFNSPYTILTAQGGLGPTLFDSLVTPAGITGSLSYTATDVDLTLMSALGKLPGLNVNQRNVANVLDFGFNTTGSTSGLGAIFNGNILQNLTQASGELATGAQQATFNAMNLFLGLLTDPFLAGRDGGVTPGGAQPYAEEGEGSLAYAAKKQNAARDALAKMPTKADAARNDLFDPHWSVWGSAYGGGANIDGNAALGSNSANVRAFGFVAGADYRISRDTIAGFALGGGGTNFGVVGFGTGRSDLFQAGAFVRHTIGAAYVTAATAYGWQDVTTDRTVTIAGLDRLRAEFNANAFSGRIEGGYRFVTPWMGVTPYAAGQFTAFSLPAYAEQVVSGTGAFALNYAAKDVTDPRTELGVRTDKSFGVKDGILVLRSRFAWAHDFNTDRNVAAVFQTLPGASFVVNGAAQSHDSALTTGSVEMRWLNGWSAAATFEGEFSGISQFYAGKGVVRYAW
jgi:autotransporter-associated beta strand protein